MSTAQIGLPIDRVDGPAKVTGRARYAAEYPADDLAYGWVVTSSIARGRIVEINAGEALTLPGVLQVFTHENCPRLARLSRSYRDEVAPPGKPLRPLHDDEVRFNMQPIALVVADRLELARYASSLVRVSYDPMEHTTDLASERDNAYRPKERSGVPLTTGTRGHAQREFERAEVKIEGEYLAPTEHHNPMELFGTTVVYGDDGRLTVYDKTQGSQNVHSYLANVFGYSPEQLRVCSPYVGGAFGSGLRPQYQVFLALLAAQELKRSVRVALTRQQMFGLGYRPATWQRVALGASAAGQLNAILHETVAQTSRYEDYSESVSRWSGVAYQCDHVALDHQLVQLDVCTPVDMRAPGAVWGMYALECAMDELAVKLQLDPVELRLRNYAEQDPEERKPYSSKELRECYRQAAEAFGWQRRTPEPCSMRDGNDLIGWGMAGGCWEANQQEASAKAVLGIDGHLLVASATADIGTGTYTIMTQIAADALGLPIGQVTFKLGDSSLPTSPVEGGSWTAATIGCAVKAVCEKLGQELLKLANSMDGLPLANAALEDVEFAGGMIRLRHDPARAVSIIDAMRHSGVNVLEAHTTSRPSRQQMSYARFTHSAIFAEVRVDEDFGTVRVPRVVSAIAGGRILNPKTARSQVLGGIVWGIGSALTEESVMDNRFGRYMNHNLAEYHVPVNADVHDVQVIFVREVDEHVNALGVKGLGEIGIVGVAAAIANAVYHATGKRVRELPITPDKLLSLAGE